jgi:hypothetical protein
MPAFGSDVRLERMPAFGRLRRNCHPERSEPVRLASLAQDKLRERSRGTGVTPRDVFYHVGPSTPVLRTYGRDDKDYLSFAALGMTN